MMGQISHLEVLRLKKTWWWLDPQARVFADPKDEQAALFWELVRRVESYQLLWRNIEPSMRANRRNRIYLLRLFSFLCEQLDLLGWLLMLECDPTRTWIELTPGQRQALSGRTRFLPREVPPSEILPMAIFACTVIRRNNIEIISNSTWEGYALQSIKPVGEHVLPDNSHEQSYIVIQFDHRMGKDEIARQLDNELAWRFNLRPGEKIETLAKQNFDVSTLPICPKLWKPDDSAIHHSSADVTLMPSADQPFVLCWIPAFHSLRSLRERFHNQIRRNNLGRHRSRFRRTWEQQVITVKYADGSSQTLEVYPNDNPLADELRVKAANSKQFSWEGLSAYDSIPKQKNPATELLFDFVRKQAGPLATGQKNKLLKKWRHAVVAFRKRLHEVDSHYSLKVKGTLRDLKPPDAE